MEYLLCSNLFLSLILPHPFFFFLFPSLTYPPLPQLRKDQRNVIFKRVEQYVKEAKVVFVVRIRGLACCVCVPFDYSIIYIVHEFLCVHSRIRLFRVFPRVCKLHNPSNVVKYFYIHSFCLFYTLLCISISFSF